MMIWKQWTAALTVGAALITAPVAEATTSVHHPATTSAHKLVNKKVTPKTAKTTSKTVSKTTGSKTAPKTNVKTTTKSLATKKSTVKPSATHWHHPQLHGAA